MCLIVFFFNDTATTEIYTLSLHDALPISDRGCGAALRSFCPDDAPRSPLGYGQKLRRDRKSTRLNSSHVEISYAVFCLKKKTKPSEQEMARYERVGIDPYELTRLHLPRNA